MHPSIGKGIRGLQKPHDANESSKINGSNGPKMADWPQMRAKPLMPDRYFPRQRGFLTIAALLWVLAPPFGRGHSVIAGLSSENVIVVVNGDSTISRTIANHYVHLREIPSRNVVVLRQIPKGIETDLKTFRDKILDPVLQEIDRRKLSLHVRTIAYSADLPVAIRIDEHTDKLPEGAAKKYQLPVASINGLTFFYRFVRKDSHGYLGFGANLYARGRFERHFMNPFTGELRQKFVDASKLSKEEQHAEAAALWDELHQVHPEMPAIALRAAEAHSLANQTELAVARIKAAIQTGWWSSSYLYDTPALEKHLEDPVIQKALPLMDDSPIAWQGPIGFASDVGWATTGQKVSIAKGGSPFLMSCVLAVVHPNGSTTSDAIRTLQRASGADRTFPKARFAFGGGSGVRMQTRFPGIADAIVYLQEHGHETEIFRGYLPDRPGPIVGLMTGGANLPFAKSPLALVPGSIAENLTSFGGVFANGSQTKLTDFLTLGAAVSSGAVTEPYSLPYKFPSPMLYAYYARGLSAIESFYQSVSSPYQLLIVGDPLTQPFAKAPSEFVDMTLIEGDPKKVRFARRGLRLNSPSAKTAAIDLSINGQAIRNKGQLLQPAQNIEINWPADAAGFFDVRATLIGMDRTEPRISFASEIDFRGKEPAPSAKILASRKNVSGLANDGSLATPIEMELKCDGADRIDVEHFGEVVASTSENKTVISIETDKLGGGPLRFRPIAFFGEKRVQGKTLVDEATESR